MAALAVQKGAHISFGPCARYFSFPTNLSPQSTGGLSPASKQLKLSLFNQHQEFWGIWQASKHPSWHFPSQQHLSCYREDHRLKAGLCCWYIDLLACAEEPESGQQPPNSFCRRWLSKTCLTFIPDPGNSKPLHIEASYPTTTISDMRFSWGTRRQ